MNVLKAREILELPDNYNEQDLKKNYHSLAMKYHPDKNKTESSGRFVQISEAYEFLSKKEPGSFKKVDDLFSTILKSFKVQFPNKPLKKPQNTITVKLTAKQYLNGTTKSINVKERCSCEPILCLYCAGCGFNLPPPMVLKKMDPCMNCVGEGYTQSCKECTNGIIFKYKTIYIPPQTNFMEIESIGSINVSVHFPYFVRENKLYCTFDISLKESLTGFNKIFKDPFGNDHNVSVNTIVKSNDGYQIDGAANVILVFNVIYPTKLNEAVIEQLKKIDF
jgi:DnaJ-class molecular chaperone